MTEGGSALRVLVLGGAGVFGSRLITGLLDTTGFDVIAAGRSAKRLAPLVGRPRVSCLNLNARTVTPAELAATGAFAVVDAAGPYQGGQYALARAAIAAGLHFIDLADARDHVAGFGALDGAARDAGVVALTGASSTPALSNAALEEMAHAWRQVDTVEIAISPGNRAPRGLAVVRSILSYAGRPVRVFIAGRWGPRPGWGMLVRRRMPGLGWRWLSLAEVPDLDIVPARFGVRRSAVFRAGLELPVLHLGLWLASLPVRARLIPSLTPLARLVRGLAAPLDKLGTDRGGMTVSAWGLDADGRAVRALWSLVAEAGDGPFIPTLPALALLRALAAGMLTPGARACVGLLSLADIEAEFRGRRISSRMWTDGALPCLYERVLGAGFMHLPAPLQRVHQPGWGAEATGVATVDGADTLLARLAAALFRLPRAGEAVPLRVSITPVGGRERWVRAFAGRSFASLLSMAAPGRLVERFGPFAFELEVLAGPNGVSGMPVRTWRIGRLTLPRRLAPISLATESVDAQGRFQFDVELRLPLGLGRLVRYRGWLVPEA